MYVHQRSGLNLTMFRAYNPALARWLNRDPLGEVAGINLYAYTGNSPINFRDPSGLLFGGTINAGEGYGQSAVDYYAAQVNANQWDVGAWTGGTLSALWTPATSDDTFSVLSMAAGMSSSKFFAGKPTGTYAQRYEEVVASGRDPWKVFKEWSHALPERLKVSKGGDWPDWIIDSPLNGNMRTAWEHVMNDPIRQQGSHFPASVLRPEWQRIWNRIPDWIKGLWAAGMTQYLKNSNNSNKHSQCD